MDEKELRLVLENQVREKILGPGFTKDVIVCSEDASDEILDTTPLDYYCTGILLPVQPDLDSLEGDRVKDNTVESETDGRNFKIDGQPDSDSGKIDGNEDKNDRDTFKSNHIGIISCYTPDTRKLRLDIQYAIYHRMDKSEISDVKIKLGNEFENFKKLLHEYDKDQITTAKLSEKGIEAGLSSLFDFDEDNRIVWLKHNISDLRLNINTNYKKANNLFRILCSPAFFRRVPKHESLELTIDETAEKEINEDLKCYVSSYNYNGKKYVKVLLRNIHEYVDSINCILFQTEMKLTPVDGKMVSYVEPIVSVFDSEHDLNEFIYREVDNFGKGVGCAVTWNSEGTWVKTTYLPRCEVKKFSNEVRSGSYNEEDIKECCKLRNLSIWQTDTDDNLLNRLSKFVDGYAVWHETEKKNAQLDGEYKKEKEMILKRQEALLERLRDNIHYMRVNDEALECFKIANTAMLIQMVISRDTQFTKNRFRSQITQDESVLDDLRYFEDAKYLATLGNREPAYRPFQLAFLLMNVKSTFEDEDKYRNESVDLIWFPTGGGKTEAYLALTALTIVARRRGKNEQGVSVVMRYTLRLLATQQFERASLLICTLDFLRTKVPDLNLGQNSISIGLWVGKAATPNSVAELTDKNSKYYQFMTGIRSDNPFPVAYCPWCGGRLEKEDNDQGYSPDGKLKCRKDSCHFTTLPIHYIDEIIYKEIPTLLFATVDKFAQLYNQNAANLLRNKHKSVDLIIQDELHLISGPLGSMVGLFEMIVEEMVSKDGRRPKIIASTATTRNTSELVKNLYGNRKVNVFPAQGLSYRDNFFSHLEEASLRTHIGIMPTGRANSNETEIRMTAILVLARIKLFKMYLEDKGIDLTDKNAVAEVLNDNGQLVKDLDLYWSIVLYYNSLKDLGRSNSRVSQEVYENVRSKLPYVQCPSILDFIYSGFNQRKREFTSREDSSKIKDLLTTAESRTRLDNRDNGLSAYDDSNIDLVFASNMISVGIDIARWNIMLMMGQPRATAEYIQSSSRVARSHQGLVLNLLNPLRNREYSLFENYTSFHAAYYKYVEPLSATPLTIQTMNTNLMANIIKCFKEYITSEREKEDIVDELVKLFVTRFNLDDYMKEYLTNIINETYDVIRNGNGRFMSSLRDIDVDCYATIKSLNY